MKKLLIAAAALAVGFAAQAAQYNWTTGDSAAAGFAPTYPDPDEPGEYLYYAAKGDIYIYHNSGETARDTIISAIAAGTWTVGEGAFDHGTFTDGIFDFKSPTGQPLLKGEEFYAVLVANEATDWEGNVEYTATDKYAFVTGAGAVPQTATDIGAPPVTMGIDWDASTTVGPGGWVAMSAVPEPTSGLLLLLGVAGLALRRRRA